MKILAACALILLLGLMAIVDFEGEKTNANNGRNFMIVSSFDDDGYLKALGIVDDDAYHDTIRIFERENETLLTREAYTDDITGLKNPAHFMLFYYQHAADSGYFFSSSLTNQFTKKKIDENIDKWLEPSRRVSKDVLINLKLATKERFGKNSIQAIYFVPNFSNGMKSDSTFVEFDFDSAYITLEAGSNSKNRLSMAPGFDSLFQGHTKEIIIRGPAFYSKHLKKQMSKGVRRRFSIEAMDYSPAFADSLFDACKKKIRQTTAQGQ